MLVLAQVASTSTSTGNGTSTSLGHQRGLSGLYKGLPASSMLWQIVSLCITIRRGGVSTGGRTQQPIFSWKPAYQRSKRSFQNQNWSDFLCAHTPTDPLASNRAKERRYGTENRAKGASFHFDGKLEHFHFDEKQQKLD